MKEAFQTLCEADCEAVRLPAVLEPAMTFGFYQPPTAAQPKGQYFYNGLNSEEKNQIGAGSLAYHELIPGHHFQLALVEENEGLHPLLKILHLTANTEGWAEYAAMLAGEMGMYENPLDEYGRLTMDLFLTTRLVVDTGMNAFGWPREKAAALLKENSEFSDHMIFTETNRYSNDLPGQALAYKYGSLKMREIREKAKQALGSLFDIREYHERVLEIGFAPLKVLEMHIDWWVEQKLRGE